MSSERTEAPTQRRLTKAREEGQIARSRDLALAAASIAATMAAARLGERLVEGLGGKLREDLARFGDAPLRQITPGDLQQSLVSAMWILALLVGPIALATMAAGVAMHGFQGGWSFAPNALKLNWSRLNPANGVKRFGLTQSGADTVKTLILVTALAWIGWKALALTIEDSVAFMWVSPHAAGARAWMHANGVLWNTAWALTAMALFDYGLQKYRLHESLKMSKQEIRDEAKEQEGSGEVKAKARRLAREMSRRRMMRDVPTATVVLTNPTHFAVALRYDRRTMIAPEVVAKGADHLAQKIRAVAREHGVPIIENPPLARMLHATAEVGETIPADLFNAVAEVLAYLVRIKQVML